MWVWCTHVKGFVEEILGRHTTEAIRGRLNKGLEGRPITWLAEATGDPYKNVQRWMQKGRGGKNAPPVDFVARYLEAVAVNADWILREEGPMRREKPAVSQDKLARIQQILAEGELGDLSRLGHLRDQVGQLARRHGMAQGHGQDFGVVLTKHVTAGFKDAGGQGDGHEPEHLHSGRCLRRLEKPRAIEVIPHPSDSAWVELAHFFARPAHVRCPAGKDTHLLTDHVTVLPVRLSDTHLSPLTYYPA